MGPEGAIASFKLNKIIHPGNETLSVFFYLLVFTSSFSSGNPDNF